MSMCAPTTRAHSAAPVELAISSSIMAKHVKVDCDGSVAKFKLACMRYSFEI